METPEELLQQAAALDGEALSFRDHGTKADELRRQAADLRIAALGPKPYPLLVCGACFRLTGWLGADGTCEECLRAREEHATRSWLRLDDLRPPPEPERVPPLRRLKRALGVGSGRDRAREWLSKVAPGETGPIQPEEGWAVEWAVKSEHRAPEGPHLLVAFDVQSFRFEFAAWRPVETTPGGKPRILTPREFAASLEISALALAWRDFVAEVDEHNRAVWRAEAERREAAVHAETERRNAEELERGTSRLLG
ncbi:MAG TPA: hypothetical protein VHD91_06150 [Gaiellaceae bacterium]|nr:hypothetical protein [Gaiellaceae bacterium]